ncbi:MAG TPA: hypothetical protein VKW06_06690 [Candidatus Angelobacter sp.]|nr:hypothetical protein [Candidatus Angelobacter sp.]
MAQLIARDLALAYFVKVSGVIALVIVAVDDRTVFFMLVNEGVAQFLVSGSLPYFNNDDDQGENQNHNLNYDLPHLDVDLDNFDYSQNSHKGENENLRDNFFHLVSPSRRLHVRDSD